MLVHRTTQLNCSRETSIMSLNCNSVGSKKNTFGRFYSDENNIFKRLRINGIAGNSVKVEHESYNTKISDKENICPLSNIDKAVLSPTDSKQSNSDSAKPSANEVLTASISKSNLSVKLSARCAILISDRSAIYSKNFGVDNSLNNFWGAFSYERQALQADAKHPGYYLNDSCLSHSLRAKIIGFLSILSDQLTPESSCQVFAIACNTFDRYMALKSNSNKAACEKTLKQSDSVTAGSNPPLFTYNNIKDSCLFAQLVALSSFSLAIKHEYVKSVDCKKILKVWKALIRSSSISQSWVGYKDFDSCVIQIIRMEFTILSALTSSISVPNPIIMVEDLLNSTIKTKNCSSNIRISSSVNNSHSNQAKILARVAFVNSNIALSYVPSVQAAAMASLINEFTPSKIKAVPSSDSEPNLIQADKNFGGFNLNAISGCKKELMKCFLIVKNLFKNVQLSEYRPLYSWLRSIEKDSTTDNLISMMVLKYMNYLNKHSTKFNK